MHIKTRIRRLLEGQLNQQYAARLARAKRRISYEEWLRLQEDRRAASSDRGEQNGTEGLAEQGICLILQRRGQLDPDAPRWIADYFAAHPEIQVLYGDEDVSEACGCHRCSPFFKPDWSPDTWLSCFYLGSVIAVRRELAEQLPELSFTPESGKGRVLLFTDTAQVRLPVHQLLALAEGFTPGIHGIGHIPRMLFHMNHDGARDGVQKEYRLPDEFDCSGQIVSEVTQLLAEAEPSSVLSVGGKKNSPGGTRKQEIRVSVIIPSKDNPQVLGQCLESLQKCQESVGRMEQAGADWESEERLCSVQLEILVVDNGSNPENRKEIEKITHGMKYIYQPMPFNFSRMCNLGARAATGELLLFLNDDITVCGDSWLAAMADRALRPYVGAVGLKLYYPDSRRIQHAGITNLPGGPVHKLQFTEDGQEEDYGYGSLDRNVVAVTGACLMVQRDRFWQAGGFPEDLQVAYNDVALCFSLREAGWHNVVLNRYHAYHHESLSRGSDLTREKLLRLQQERQLLYNRYPAYLDGDPYYPEPLCRELGDTHIYANYMDCRASLQVVSHCKRLQEFREQEPENLVFAVGVAAALPEEEVCLQGYIVVKWENNACYDMGLVLQKQEEDAGSYGIRLEPKYSREAEYGMQEQPNVALCGFRAALRKGALPDGSYRIGVQACSRMGRRRLNAWTEQTVQIRDGVFTMAELPNSPS
ncbi:MAG: glycosyltransferase [Lachnospiraceae bacterium]|nr:glycosyltransferase [Lachnospiraceae bacterium]